MSATAAPSPPGTRHASAELEQAKPVTRRTIGVRDVPRAFLAPRQLFARVEDVAGWGWPLVVLLTLVTLIGYATVQTGLIDREVDLGVRRSIAEIDRTRRDVVQRSELRELYEQEYKMGEFWKLLTRIQVVVAEPARMLASVFLIAAVVYGVVALTGRKPEWHTLVTICVFAGFVEALRLVVRLALMLQLHTLEVDTSLALLTRLLVGDGPADATRVTNLAALSGLLSALDPFRVWFWLVVAVGLTVTRQLPGWRAWLVCGLCWLAGGVGRAVIAATAAGSAASGGGIG